MRHAEKVGSRDRRMVSSLRKEELERRSTPFSTPIDVPIDPGPEPPQPELPPDDGARNRPVSSPPCYRGLARSNSRIHRVTP